MTSSDDWRITFSLEPTPPFRLDLTNWALRRRPENLIDRWDGCVYRRVLLLEATTAELAVRQLGSAEAPHLEVTVRLDDMVSDVVPRVTAILDRLLGLHVDLAPFYQLAAKDPQLMDLVSRFRGMKPPRFPSLFETLVNAITCQQVTLTLGLRLLNRLIECYGVPQRGDTESGFAFPRPEVLADLDPDELRSMQFSRQKARAIIELSRRVVSGQLDLENLVFLPDNLVVERLRRLYGVGRWTAEYVLLRGLGRLDVFPGDDAGARNGLAKWLDIDAKLDYDGVSRAVAGWRPFAGLLYFHLLLARLERDQLLAEPCRTV